MMPFFGYFLRQKVTTRDYKKYYNEILSRYLWQQTNLALLIQGVKHPYTNKPTLTEQLKPF